MPAILRQRLSCAPSSVAEAAFGNPVALVVDEKGPGDLDVPRTHHLQLEAHASLLALAAQLVHLRAQLLSTLGRLFGHRDLALELRDACVALPQCRLVVRASLGGIANGRAAAGAYAAWSPVPCGSCRTCRTAPSSIFVPSCKPSMPHVLSSPAGKEKARTPTLGTGYSAVTKDTRCDVASPLPYVTSIWGRMADCFASSWDD